MNETIYITNPFDGKPWYIDGRWTDFCAMLVRRNVPLTPSYETIRDLMLAGF